MGYKHENESDILDEWLDEDKLMLMTAWTRDGFAMKDIASKIGVSQAIMYRWNKTVPEIHDALKNGREIIDYKVENALLKAALGYTTKEIKVTVGRQVKDGKVYNLTKETTVKEIAPNVTACAIWLNNRLPDKWKRNRDNQFNVSDEDSNLTITVVRGNDKKDESNSKAEQNEQGSSTDQEEQNLSVLNDKVEIKPLKKKGRPKKNNTNNKSNKISKTAKANKTIKNNVKTNAEQAKKDKSINSKKNQSSLDDWPADWKDE
jgi:hypothetical protein